jgi:hypothetical protein
MPEDNAFRTGFVNGASLVLCTNSLLVYSANWTSLIAKYYIYHRMISEYDAAVLGKFNGCIGRNRLTDKTLIAQRWYPDEIHCTTVLPPSLFDVLRKTTSRQAIVAVSMFAAHNRKWEESFRATVARLEKDEKQHLRQERAWNRSAFTVTGIMLLVYPGSEC